MNHQQFTIPQLEVENQYLDDFLRCIIHTILFNRAVGKVHPKEELIETLDFAYVRCDNVLLYQSVEESIKTFRAGLSERQDRRGQRPQQISLSFFPKQQKDVFGKYKKCFEEWTLLVIFKEDEEEDTPSSRLKLEDELRERVLFVVRMINQKQNHLPPPEKGIPPDELIPFSYEISVPSASKESWGMDLVKNLFRGSRTMLT